VNAHRPSALAGVDNVLVLLNGQLQAFGPKDQVLRAPLQPHGKTAEVTALRSAEREQKSVS
jgi:ABC-type protease/lipase transport system fused ATPase/permease subunit